MKRSLYAELLEWKSSRSRKPLLLQGARQVGKTFLLTEFGKQEYKYFVYLNFEQNPDLSTIFADQLEPRQIVENIGIYYGRKISTEDTLIFFDEIQIVPKALTSLKYFYEQTPEIHIVAAGSLLGVSVGKQISFPVGKVNFMMMYPMTFHEYLLAKGEAVLAQVLQEQKQVRALTELLHHKLTKLFKIYLYVGGMPEVVQNYMDQGDMASVRSIQNEILEAYIQDFSKYTDKTQAIRTTELWQSIPYQLAKENKKFKYTDVRKGGRASTFEQTIQWLKSAGLVNVVYNISRPQLPLAGYADFSKFKIYLLDNGLLGAMLNLSSDIILKPTELYTEYNGAFVENIIAAEFAASGHKELYYWTSKSDAEVDYIIQTDSNIYPIEVKSGKNRNQKSLRSYAGKYEPSTLCRLSPRNFIKDHEFINIPLYAAFILKQILVQRETDLAQ